jgi:hypothetical protein
MTTSEKTFLLRWSLVTTLAMVLLMITTGTMPPVMAGGFAGLIVGIAQWFLLRQRVPQAYEWIIATTAGFLITVVAIDRFANVETIRLPHSCMSGWCMSYWAVVLEQASGWFCADIPPMRGYGSRLALWAIS